MDEPRDHGVRTYNLPITRGPFKSERAICDGTILNWDTQSAPQLLAGSDSVT